MKKVRPKLIIAIWQIQKVLKSCKVCSMLSKQASESFQQLVTKEGTCSIKKPLIAV
jgi:hypothetical protein